jgi:hypothetical protein
MSNTIQLGYGVVGENPDTIIIVLDASGRAQYICEAAPGSATSAAVWRIRLLTYDATTGALTNQQWAGGSNAYKNVQTTYASYSYS